MLVVLGAILVWFVVNSAPLGRMTVRRTILTTADPKRLIELFQVRNAPDEWIKFINLGWVRHVQDEDGNQRMDSWKDEKPTNGEVDKSKMNSYLEIETTDNFAQTLMVRENGVELSKWMQIDEKIEIEQVNDINQLTITVSKLRIGILHQTLLGNHLEKYLGQMIKTAGDHTPQEKSAKERISLMAWWTIPFSFIALYLAVGPVGLFVAFCLLLAILVHELGHAAVMRRFGHRRVGIMIMPFLFGGMAIGDRQAQTRFESFCVSLAGPAISALFVLALLPMAFGNSFTGSSEILIHSLRTQEVLWIPLLFTTVQLVAVVVLLLMLILNTLNLFPIGGLDGGAAIAALCKTKKERNLLILLLGTIVAGAAYYMDLPLYILAFEVAVIGWMMRGNNVQSRLLPMSLGERKLSYGALALTVGIYIAAIPVTINAMLSDGQESARLLQSYFTQEQEANFGSPNETMPAEWALRSSLDI